MDGVRLGPTEGDWLGARLGIRDGANDGDSLGFMLGCRDLDGSTLGTKVGRVVALGPTDIDGEGEGPTLKEGL